jgi:two-component system cell cycle sensor histidine kinase/response regulator CckA
MAVNEAQSSAEAERCKLAGLIADHLETLSRQIADAYSQHIFENRYILHPRRLEELGGEELEQFLAFINSREKQDARSLGRRRATEGLSHRSVTALFGLLETFFVLQLSNEDQRLLRFAVQSMDAFRAGYLDGYIQAREEEILKDQEQLRLALSAALDRQRRELLIKNHAIHTATYGVILWDMEVQITYANPAVLRMWDYPSQEKMLEDIKNWKFAGTVPSIIEELRERGHWHGENTIQLADGRSLDMEIYASLIRDEQNQPIGYISSFYDITQRKRLEAQFRQSQKMEALGQLAGGIVHDFNNLLTAISGYAQLALMDLHEGNRYYQDFQQVKKATDRGKELTEELRLFTRQSAGTREPVDLNAIVEETTKILARTFPPQLRIAMELDPQLKGLLGNTSQMSQMVMNLCVNARDAILGTMKTGAGSEDGIGAPRKSQGLLVLRTGNQDLDAATASRFLDAKPGSYVCLTVQDNGVGIPSAHLDRLFEPFFTTKGEKSGTGLGLAVVYGIVQSHGGFIEVQSREKEGSTFWVYLPAQPEAGRERRPADSAANLTVGRGTLLVVEDDSQVREMIVETLTKSGYTVLIARNGVEALSLYQSSPHPVDLVILDLVMPQMGGKECYYRLKSLNPKLKILVMTGFTADGSAEEFRREGASGVITKPFELHEFTETIQRIIRKK